jgi:dipeptidyl aminopeptidase/acylaminoacyl peptidase
VIWVGGARGGFAGPAGGIYKNFSDKLTPLGVSSLRLHYRKPNNLEECVLDTLAGISLLEYLGINKIVLVGHSFGGAVVISAAEFSNSVVGVVAMSSQTYGANRVADISPRKLLLIHGLNDKRLGPHCSEFIYEWAKEPKDMILLKGGGHGLTEVIEEVEEALENWLNEFISQKTI